MDPGVPSPSASKPCASQWWPRTIVAASASAETTPASASSPPSIRKRLPNRSVSIEAEDSKTSLARITPSASIPTRTSATSDPRSSERRRARTETRTAKTAAAPSAPRAAAKPRPSASTRPGNAAVPTACEWKARPRRTTQVPISPAPTESSATSASPRWTKGRSSDSSTARAYNRNETRSHLTPERPGALPGRGSPGRSTCLEGDRVLGLELAARASVSASKSPSVSS